MTKFRFVFFGSSDFGLPAVEALRHDPRFELVGVVTQPARPSGRGRTMTPTPVAIWADQSRITCLTWASIKNDPAIEKQIRDLESDFMLVAAYGCIVPENLLTLTRGWINLHASLLPKHRGASPIAAAIASGDETSGVSIMKMDAGIDTGPVLQIFSCPIGPAMTAPQLESVLAQLPVPVLGNTVTAWLDGKLEARPQDSALASYAPKLTKDAGHADWKSAREWERKVRAYQPWPGVWSLWYNERLAVLEADVEPGTPITVPGTVERRSSGIGVACPDGWLMLKKIQRPGKTPVDAIQAGRDWPGFVGSRLT